VRRLLIVAAVAVAAFVGPGVGQASAALSCGSIQIQKPVWQYTSPNSVSTYWQAGCSGAQWRAEITLQYESGGTWHPMNCENTTPCTIYRPKATNPYGFYAANTGQGGTVFFDPVASLCVDRMRSRLKLIGAGGTVQGPYSSAISDPC
jgi:hypothetical protein